MSSSGVQPTTAISIRLAPARRRAALAPRTVAPVVSTSSTSRIDRPATAPVSGTRKCAARDRPVRRWPVWRGAEKLRASARGQGRSNSRATGQARISVWLNPRASRRGQGERQRDDEVGWSPAGLGEPRGRRAPGRAPREMAAEEVETAELEGLYDLLERRLVAPECEQAVELRRIGDAAAAALERLRLRKRLRRRERRRWREAGERAGAEAAARERVDRYQPGVAGGAEPQRRRARSTAGGAANEVAAGEAMAGPEEIEEVEERSHGDGAAPTSVGDEDRAIALRRKRPPVYLRFRPARPKFSRRTP